MVKKLFLIILLLLVLPLLSTPVLAQEAEFSTSYDVTYSIDPKGVAEVTQKISLKNLTTKFYASNFTLTIGSTTVTDVIASDGGGPLETKIETKDNKTAINVTFNEQVAGIGKVLTFTLKFKSEDFAQNIGKTWEVNLPKIPQSPNLENYNLTLSVPITFGEPTSIVPRPNTENQVGDRLNLGFKKDQLEKNGVSVNFGTNQVFDFKLNYKLENNSLVPILTSITLPPDTAYQDVLIKSLNPVPINVTLDGDGNYLAWYKVQRNHIENIHVEGLAKLYIIPKYNNQINLSDQTKAELLKSDKYWEKENPLIKSALAEIFKDGVPTNNKDKVKKIYDYVVATLKYNTDKINQADIERLGAVTALNNPSESVCMEFTDLFIALSRASDIPARELDGFAYSRNSNLRPLSLSRDLLHAWPEYYDDVKKSWVMVDPTWENTSGGVDYFNKFDLNHLVLAIKGYSSQTPYITDDVKVSVSDIEFKLNPKVVAEVNIPEAIWSGFPTQVFVKVYNQGQSIQPSSNLLLKTKHINILDASSITLGAIPPFGYAEHKFNLRTPNVWQSFEEELEVLVNDQKFTKKVQVKPFFMFQPFPYIFLGLVVLILGVYLTVLFVHISQKKVSVAKGK